MKTTKLKRYLLLTLCISVFVFTACSKSLKSNDSTGTSSKETLTSTLSSQSPRDSLSSDILGEIVLLNSKFFKLPNDHDGYFSPISYTQNGATLLADEIDENYNFYNFENNDNMKAVLALDYYDPKSHKYSDLTVSDVVLSFNGNWDTIPVKVKYKNYFEEKEAPSKAWISYFQSKIQENTATKTPVIITDVWTFDYNGNEYAAVNATNVIKTGWQLFRSINSCSVTQVVPNGENYVMYKISAVFVNDFPYEIASYFNTITKETLDLNSPSFVYPTNIHGFFYKYNVMQYDDTLNMVEHPIFLTNTAEIDNRKFDRTQNYFVGDIDGSGDIKLVFECNAFSSFYNYTSIYNLIGNKLYQY